MCVHITSVLERHARGLVALLSLTCALTPGVRAQEGSWVGKTILTKKDGIKIVHKDQNGNQVRVATLRSIDHKILADQGGWLKVRDQGAEGWFNKADAVLLEDAVNYFTGLMGQNEKDFRAYGRRAIAWQLKGQLDSALKDYDEAIRLKPQEAAFWSNRGTVSCIKKDYDRAIKDYDEAIRLDPKYAIAFHNRGITWQWKGELDMALKDYSEAIRLDPKYASAFDGRGTVWSAKKDYDQAIKDYDEAIRLDPEYANALYNRGRTWYRKNDYDRAIKDFSEAIRLDPKNADAFCCRGNAWHDKQDYDRAIKDFNEAIRLDPTDVHAFCCRGIVWYDRQDYDRAIKDFNEVIRLDPKNADALYRRGLAWFAKKDYGRALKDYDGAIRLDPKDAFHLNAKAWLLATCPEDKHRDGKRAVELARQACELSNWKDADNLAVLAAAHAETGGFEEAIKLQMKAMELRSDDAEFQKDGKERLGLYKAGKPYRQKP